MKLKEFEKKTGIHFKTDHLGKMAGMWSLSTSCLVNPYCQARARVAGSVCAHCYAQRLLEYRETAANCFERNAEILTASIIPVNEWPSLNCLMFRFEAFGDLINETQVINYFNLCRKNPRVKFALWTKNDFIIQSVLASGIKKPANLVIIKSSEMLNTPETAPDFVDKVFTVYDKQAAKNVRINCGARNCFECGRCYTKRTGAAVSELLK